MYKDHFQLRAMPFSIAPDPSYFYLSNRHRDALTHLLHAVKGDGGIILLTGEVGAGKTTVCRRLLADLPGHVDVALIYNPRLASRELLQTLCLELDIPGDAEAGSEAELLLRVAEHVAEAGRAGRACVLIIDEAQHVSADVLEVLARLCDVGYRDTEALRVVLIGQPELNVLLAEPQNASFNDRIARRHHLGALDSDDVAGYVLHRLSVAGGRKQMFPRRLMARLHRMSQGLPRVINLICDRALLGAYVLGKDAVTGRILAEAWAESTGRDAIGSRWKRVAMIAGGGFFLLAAGASLAVALQSTPREPVPLLPRQAEVSVADLDPLDPSDWPDGMGGKRSEALAYAALLKRWGVAPPPDGASCAAEGQDGLKCVQGMDDLDVLRRLNMPAVLQLMDRRGRQMQVALVQIQKDQVVLQLGDTVRRLPTSALDVQWTRQYTILWRPPAALKGEVEAGASGPPVAWIRERIAKLKGIDPATLPTRLEGELKAGLQEFQTLEGLRVSGAGDLRTLVHLASRTEPGAPVLDATTCRR